MSGPALILVCALHLLSAPLAGIGPQRIVADLNLTTGPRGSHPTEFHRVGNRVVFAASDPNYGLELRGTDRTPGEVVLLADANPGTASSSPRLLGELDGALFYSSGPVEVPTLWRTDGTPEGTRQVRDDRGAALIVGWYAHEPSLVRWRDLLAVEGVDATAFAEAVWTVDAEGRATRLHGEPIFDYPVHLFGLAATRDRIFFQTEDAETHELAVWTSDGSAAGTRSLFEGRQGRTAAGASGEHYFFTAAGAGGSDVLYATDGRGSGAVALAEFGPYPEVGPTWFAAGPTRVYFLAGNAADDRTLWVSDGTPSGTNPVPEPSGGLRVSVYDLPGAEWLDEAFLFGAANESGPGLWVARGDGHAPERLDLGSDAQTYGAPMVEIDGRLLFGAVSGVGGDPALELWSTDGTQGGTRRVSRLCPPACDDAGFENVLRAGGIALFQVGYDWSMFGSEWLTFASDGTEAGTRLLDDSDTGPVTVVALSDAWAARVDGGFLLAAWDEQRGGVEPWHLALGDGAERKVANLQPERFPASPRRLIGAGERLFWAASSDRFYEQGWGLDGPGASPEGTPPELCGGRRIAPLAAAGDAVLWRDGGDEPWLDCLVALDLRTGEWRTLITTEDWEEPGIREPPVVVGERVYFAGRSGPLEPWIWGTDGTFEGSEPIAAAGLPDPFVLLGASSSHVFLRGVYYADTIYSVSFGGGVAEAIAPLDLAWALDNHSETASAGPRFFFTLQERGGNESLRVSDGTATGTRELWRSAGDAARLLELYPWGEGVLFLVGSDRMTLWRSDGTVVGTFPLADLGSLRADADDLAARASVAYGGRLFFVAESAELGAELWSTDGSAAGTTAFDLVPGAASSAPSELTVAGGALFFAAEAPGFGREVWASDGTPAGTRRVTDIAAGAASSMPESFAAAGSTLYFAADDGFRDRELWSIDASAAPGCVPSDRRLCLLDGRFAVEGAWRDFSGGIGDAIAIPLSDASGAFWYFDSENVESVVKLLDGRPVNESFWFFYGSLSNTEFDLQVTDTENRVSRRYSNPAGRFASVGDVGAFEETARTDPAEPATTARRWSESVPAAPASLPFAEEVATGLCAPSENRLCLREGRFSVEARWRDFEGREGVAWSRPWTTDTGSLWFFDPEIPELVVKVLDGRAVNGRHWVFAASLSNVEFSLTVTDLLTGAVREYANPPGSFASFGDVDAF